MRNLTLSDVTEKTVQLKGGPRNLCCGYATSEERGVVYFCDSNLSLTKHDLQKGTQCWSKPLPEPSSPDECVINMTYLALADTVTVGFRSGEIWTVQGKNGSIEEAGTCATGLAAMEWSPDQELVVLVSSENQMILMSYLLDPIAEQNLTDEEFGEKNFITVGWGKKETQFHGSEGKQAAKAKIEIVADKNYVDETPRITWRGDGQMYAVGTVVNGIRVFKVFDRDGQLQYTSEKQVGLEANLAWRPSGNLIATTQRLPNKYVVAFFEKNGLKHGDFAIPVYGNTVIEDLLWSNDSEILALKCYDSEKKVNSLLLFTCSNYHWYLKQTIAFPTGQKITKALWDCLWEQNFDMDSSKKLHVFLDDEKHYTYHWNWNVNHSNGKDLTDDAVVGVIDGKKLLLTAFRHAVVPPPMSAFQIEVENNINHVFFGPLSSDVPCSWNSNAVCICTDDKLIFYKQTSKVPLKYEQLGLVQMERNGFSLHKYNWLWISNDTFLCTAYENGYKVQEYSMELIGDTCSLKLQNSVELKCRAWALQPHPHINSIAFILGEADIFRYTIGGYLDTVNLPMRTGSVKLQVFAIQDVIYFITLTYKNDLSINNSHNVLSHVSSMFVQSNFLLLTTLQHELICTELTTDALEALMDITKLSNSSHIYKRKIERGATLIVAVSCDTRTIFQLPRGNLEAIQPRPLSLKIIGEYLDHCKFFAAFDLMRKQRINLNLIYDHNPEHLLLNVDIFLTEIKNPSWLSLFLSDLDNIDVTKTMYASSYSAKTPMSNENMNSKVITICETIRQSLAKSSSSDEKVLPILTSYVKKNSIEDLEKALTVIKDLRNKENNGQKSIVGSDEALRYLLYLVDVSYLYDIALGMYDFDMVLLVANKSQKDPKEYVPMLNEFNDMEENYKRFSINKALKRFNRAVQCLAQCGPSFHEELRIFVKYHSLFSDALALFEPKDEVYQNICEDYGLHLKLKKQYTEAAFIYRRGGNVEKSVECFKEALEWELALETAHSLPKEQFVDLCRYLVTRLKEDKRHSEALTLLEQYCEDQMESIKYALECCHFRTSLRLCQKYGKGEIAESFIQPRLLDEYGQLLVIISNNADTFNKHKARLILVRNNKLPKGNAIDMEYLNKDSDLYSDAGSTLASTGSRCSSRSFKSNKNRRKHERKLVSLKEGSQYEDVALVTAVHALVTSSFQLRTLVKEVNLSLCWFRRDQLALALQTNLDNLLKTMKDSLKEIWTNEFMLEATNASMAAQQDTEGVPQGIAALDLILRIPPVIPDINWKLEALKTDLKSESETK